MKEIIKIEINEKDIKMLVAEKYGLDVTKAIVRVNHYAGDQREPAYTKIIVEGERSVIKV